jgi:signal transduction histidine kinase
MIAGGVRMQRMLDQVLDLSRVRLAGGILVERGEPRDLAPLVSDIVEETRAAHPTRTIELSTSASMARVDADRFEQVVSSLLENALVHGAPDEPVRVELAPRGAFVTLRVHNAGAPVDAASLEHLFKPFQRGLRPRTGKGGLGLGLYISERIVTAHGGSIKVESDATSGTTFEACFPCG